MKRIKLMLIVITVGTFLCGCGASMSQSEMYKKMGFWDVEELNISEIYPFAKCQPLGKYTEKISYSRNAPSPRDGKQISYECDDGYVLFMYGFYEDVYMGKPDPTYYVGMIYRLIQPSSGFGASYSHVDRGRVSEFVDFVRRNKNTNEVWRHQMYLDYPPIDVGYGSISPEELVEAKKNKYFMVKFDDSGQKVKMSTECTHPKQDYGPKENIRIVRKCLEEYKECLKTRPITTEFIHKIIVEPQVINESGFDAGDKKVDISITGPFPDSCPIYLDKIDYSVNIKPSYSNFIATTEPETYTLKYNSEGYHLKPTVKLLSKNFGEMFPGAIIENNFLKITLNKIVATPKQGQIEKGKTIEKLKAEIEKLKRELWRQSDVLSPSSKRTKEDDIKAKENEMGRLLRPDTDIEFNVDIENTSPHYINIQAISLYINDSILTSSFDQSFPPHSNRNNLAIYPKTLGIIIGDRRETEIWQKAFDAINVNLTRETAREKSITVGIAAKYEIEGKTQTLFKSFLYKYSSLLADK